MTKEISCAGKALKKLMDERNYNPNKLAKEMGNKSRQVQAHRIITGVTKEPKDSTLKPFADFFGVPLSYFHQGNSEVITNINFGAINQVVPNVSAVPSVSLVPVISFVQAGMWSECIDTFAPNSADDWLPCPSKHGDHTFALRVQGDSMTCPYPSSRSYPDGSIIFVDPDAAISNGDRIVAKLTDLNEATFKVYVEESGLKFLKPLNPQYPNININGNCHIVGKVIGSYMPE